MAKKSVVPKAVFTEHKLLKAYIEKWNIVQRPLGVLRNNQENALYIRKS